MDVDKFATMSSRQFSNHALPKRTEWVLAGHAVVWCRGILSTLAGEALRVISLLLTSESKATL